ncbi:MAG: WbqC family protein [Acidobacteriota bacterium]
MRVGLIQSNYIPWKGYFDIINDVDLFIFHDDLQYTKGDWRNRNRIKTRDGTRWLTIPVGTSEHRLICDVPLPNDGWADDHWRRLELAYRDAPYFAEYRRFFRDLYLGRRWQRLSELNQAFIVAIARELLGISTPFMNSQAFGVTSTKSRRVLDLARLAGATTYLSGPSARNYLDETAFERAGITIEWKSYAGYPVYTQLHPPFEHAVTILDLLFHTGPDAPWFIWGWRDARPAVVVDKVA